LATASSGSRASAPVTQTRYRTYIASSVSWRITAATVTRSVARSVPIDRASAGSPELTCAIVGRAGSVSARTAADTAGRSAIRTRSANTGRAAAARKSLLGVARAVSRLTKAVSTW
jgi:hypothetical protein